MIARFCLYSVLKNLRFSDPFLVIYLIEIGFSYAEIGAILGFQRLVTALLEIPSGIWADRWGRRRVLATSFAMHATGLSILALGSLRVGSSTAMWFYAGLGIYGMGEAFRTGSHKAIMLDYLEFTNQAERTTAVLSFTRTFSKVSSALTGIAAGTLLYMVHDYSLLFWLSAVAAGCGFLLIISYPDYLEGEIRRAHLQPSQSFDESESKLATMIRNRRMWPLMVRSVLFESQVEVVLKLFLQPFLHLGLSAVGIPLLSSDGAAASRGAGSLVVGVNELFRDGLGAVGARNSARFEKKMASRRRAMWLIYLSTAATILLISLTALDVDSLFLPGLVAIGVVTLLQNLRRPLFVSELNDVANKPLRATILSIDNQATSFGTAVLMPLMGLAADRWGLWVICVFSGVLLLIGSVYRTNERKDSVEQPVI